MDLVERLRAEAEGMPKDYIKNQAADRITELEAELAAEKTNNKQVRKDLLDTVERNKRLRAVYEAAKRLTSIWGLEDTAYADVERYMGDLEMAIEALKGVASDEWTICKL